MMYWPFYGSRSNHTFSESLLASVSKISNMSAGALVKQQLSQVSGQWAARHPPVFARLLEAIALSLLILRPRLRSCGPFIEVFSRFVRASYRSYSIGRLRIIGGTASERCFSCD